MLRYASLTEMSSNLIFFGIEYLYASHVFNYSGCCQRHITLVISKRYSDIWMDLHRRLLWKKCALKKLSPQSITLWKSPFGDWSYVGCCNLQFNSNPSTLYFSAAPNWGLFTRGLIEKVNRTGPTQHAFQRSWHGLLKSADFGFGSHKDAKIFNWWRDA